MIETLDNLDFNGRENTASSVARWKLFKAFELERLERRVDLMDAIGLKNSKVEFQRRRLQQLRSIS